MVEEVLKNCGERVSQRFHEVRLERSEARHRNTNLFKTIETITKTTDRENANVGYGPSPKLLQIAEAATRVQAEMQLPSRLKKAWEDKVLYYHDFSWAPVGTTTCTQIPLRKLLKDGFYIEGKFIREPKRIMSAAELACIIIQSNQNDQHGGQAFGWFDRDLAPYVEREYDYQLEEAKADAEEDGITLSEEKLHKKAWRKTVKETQRAMKGVIYNLNTMHARAGAQTPFSSINLGTDHSRGGRLITHSILMAYEAGLGKGEQPLFPNIIFKVRRGVNFEEGTINHDLLRRSLEVSSKRLYPIYCFQDCTLNAPFKDDIPSMGCRTRVAGNIHSKEQNPEGRGNLSFTTVNLPGIALREQHQLMTDLLADLNGIETCFERLVQHYGINLLSEHQTQLVKRFFVSLDEAVEMAIEQLIYRYKQQIHFTKSDFSFLMSGVWKDSEKLRKADTLESVLKHGALSVGFIGLAETLTVLIGQHHAQSKEALALGLEIIRFMKAKMDEAQEIHQLNFGLLATPAEGLTGKLLRHDRSVYGVIEGVTDKDWYTNSCHVPVEYKVSYYEKLQIEGQFVPYCGAGTITYIELSEAPEQNPEAMYQIIQMMAETDICLGAINFPSDRCIDCGFHGVIRTADCPVCESDNIERIARITGYLAPLSNFNAAKKEEFLHRVKHDCSPKE